MCDYEKLSKIKKEKNYRKLQEESIFIYWSEFHANYLVYKYLYYLGKNNIEPIIIANKIKSKMIEYYTSSNILDISNVVDFTVRKYGDYIALYESYSDKLDKYIKGGYLNEKFLKLYEFLYDHNTFESMICCYKDLIDIFESLEN